MALRFIDGFDHLLAADLGKKWSSVSGASVGTSSPAPRTGVGQWAAVAGTQPGLTLTLDNQATWIVGWAVYLNYAIGAITLCQFLDSTTLQCDLRVNASGNLLVTRNGTALTLSGGGTTSTYVLPAFTWVHIQFKVTIANAISAGTCKVQVNGIEVLDVAAGQDTQNTVNAFANQLKLTGGPNVTTMLDDVYLCDGTGTINKDFLGDCRVSTLYPTGAGSSTQWTPSAGSNFGCVDEPQANSDTDYVSASAAALDLYAMGDLPGAAIVLGVQTNLFARKDDAGSRTLAAVIKSGAVTSDGTTISINNTYVNHWEVRERDPNGNVAWTATAVNNLEAGARLVS